MTVLDVTQAAGGQQLQVGRSARLGGIKSEPRSSNGYRIGFNSNWKKFGKKAKMKITRKIMVLRRLVSNGIEIFDAVTSVVTWVWRWDGWCGAAKELVRV